MRLRNFAFACGLLLATAACSSRTPTEVSGTPTVPIPDDLDQHYPIPPIP